MQEQLSNVTLIVILVTSVVSLIAFQNRELMLKLWFHEYSILERKEWYRLISHALVHGSMMHLLFNMMTLFFFADVINDAFGPAKFLIIYIVSIFSGGLVSLIIHKKQPNYTAVGASGGVVGILFASIAIYPFAKITIFPFPFGIDGWIFAVLYLSFTVYSMKYMQESQIGHDAHLGGAIAGIVSVFVIDPSVVIEHGIYLLAMLVPVVIGIFYISKNIKN